MDDSPVRTYEGTGIGLALVHELTLRLGGTIRVESQLQGTAEPAGTQFVIELPLQRADHSAQTQPLAGPTVVVDVAPVAEEPGEGPDTELARDTPLVLVVEDNAELREFIVTELATTYRVRSAVNGYEGWLIAKEELPDVVISDLMMPRMDGYALLQQLKTGPATDHIAVVLLTARVEEDDRLRGFESGADEYLTKPFHVAELRLRLRNLITHRLKLREQYGRELAQPNAENQPPTVQNQFLQRLDDSLLSVE